MLGGRVRHPALEAVGPHLLEVSGARTGLRGFQGAPPDRHHGGCRRACCGARRVLPDGLGLECVRLRVGRNLGPLPGWARPVRAAGVDHARRSRVAHVLDWSLGVVVGGRLADGARGAADARLSDGRPCRAPRAPNCHRDVVFGSRARRRRRHLHVLARDAALPRAARRVRRVRRQPSAAASRLLELARNLRGDGSVARGRLRGACARALGQGSGRCSPARPGDDALLHVRPRRLARPRGRTDCGDCGRPAESPAHHVHAGARAILCCGDLALLAV